MFVNSIHDSSRCGEEFDPLANQSYQLREAHRVLREGVSFCSVCLIPIFDTSAIINLSKRDSADPASNRLRSTVPQRGWPLSFVTVLELFNGLSRGGAEHFDESLKPVNLASRLSRRRVLLQSIPFIQKELFNVIDRRHQVSTENLTRYLGMLQQPNAKNDFVAGRFMFLQKIEKIITTMRQGYKDFMEGFLDEKMPDWRSERQKSGSPLPKTEREKLKHTLPGDKWKRDLATHYVAESFNGSTPDEFIRLVCDRCDAYLTFTVSVEWNPVSWRRGTVNSDGSRSLIEICLAGEKKSIVLESNVDSTFQVGAR